MNGIMKYRARCEECAWEHEYEQKITKNTVPRCPECGGKSRQIPTPSMGFILNGSGWPGKDSKR